MECDNCGDQRVASINGKCSDLFFLDMREIRVENDYVPGDWGIGGGDYIQFEYCLNCGKIQGEFPIEVTDLEMEHEVDEDGEHPFADGGPDDDSHLDED